MCMGSPSSMRTNGMHIFCGCSRITFCLPDCMVDHWSLHCCFNIGWPVDFFWGNQEHLNLLKVSLMYVTLHESPTAGHFQHLLQRTSILNMQFGVGWGWVCSSQNVSVSYALLGYPYLVEHPAFQVTSDTVCIQKDVHVRMYVLKDLWSTYIDTRNSLILPFKWLAWLWFCIRTKPVITAPGVVMALLWGDGSTESQRAGLHSGGHGWWGWWGWVVPQTLWNAIKIYLSNQFWGSLVPWWCQNRSGF